MYSNDELAAAYRTLETRLQQVEDAIIEIQHSVKIIEKSKK